MASSVKAGSLVKCVKVDADSYLTLGIVYTCLNTRDDLIKVHTIRGGEQWYTAEYLNDLFGPQGD